MLLVMKQQELIKKLQNLFSWKQFYQWNDNFDSVEKTQLQIDEIQILINENKHS